MSAEKTQVLQQFADEHPRCWLCGADAQSSWPPRLEIHHIVRGPNRAVAREEPCVLVRACPKCHSQRLDGMPIVTQLAIKAIHDPRHYDRVCVNLLRHRAADAITDMEVASEAERLIQLRGERKYIWERL